MNSYIKFAVIGCCSLIFTSCATGSKDGEKQKQTEQHVIDSEALIKEYMTMLKSELTSALKHAPPEDAINACNQSAPVISAALYEKYGWKIGRTSLKTRNQSNAPDAWEKKILDSFETRRTEGEPVQDLTHQETTNMDGKKTFRYMKAIPTMMLCLDCHGENLSPKVQAKLNEVYPDDKAVNFKHGDIRGAFTISQDVE